MKTRQLSKDLVWFSINYLC